MIKPNPLLYPDQIEAAFEDFAREVVEHMDKNFAEAAKHLDALFMEVKAMREGMMLARRRYEARNASVPIACIASSPACATVIDRPGTSSRSNPMATSFA